MNPHKHEPWGTETVLERREADDYTKVQASCPCGVVLIRETAPKGARYNWQDWQVNA